MGLLSYLRGGVGIGRGYRGNAVRQKPQNINRFAGFHKEATGLRSCSRFPARRPLCRLVDVCDLRFGQAIAQPLPHKYNWPLTRLRSSVPRSYHAV